MVRENIPAWGTKQWVEQYIEQHGFPPIAGGAPDEGEQGEQGAEAGEQGESGAEAGNAGEQGADGAEAGEQGESGEQGGAPIDWKAQSRKHEDRHKTAQKRIDELEAQIAEREELDKTDQEKALDAAREEGRTEVRTEVRGQLLAAEIKAATAGRFEYPDLIDANVLGLKVEDVFDGDEIDGDLIAKAVADLLEKKPKLAAGAAKVQGSADGGKGSGGGKSLESMSAADHLAEIQGKK